MTQPHPSSEKSTGAASSPTQPPEIPQDVRSLNLNFALLVFSTLICSMLPLPFSVSVFLFGITAVVFGIKILRKAVKLKLPASYIISPSLGLAVVLFSMVGAGATMVFWPIQQSYEECTRAAITTSAQETCQHNLEDGYQRILDQVRSQTPS